MPKERPTVRTLDHCSFCSDHKDDVPLLITNAGSTAACCSTCALSIIDQTYSWAGKIFKTLQVENARQKVAEKKILTGGTVDEAIKRAGG